jgi:CheY-like chemotaxis protein
MESTNKKIIFLVEDDADIREALVETLEHENFTVVLAHNGRDALHQLQDGLRPHLILLDAMMPIMSGIEFRRSQLKNPDIALIPVILISADLKLKNGLPELNVQSVMPKPFSIDALIATIATTLDQLNTPARVIA